MGKLHLSTAAGWHKSIYINNCLFAHWDDEGWSNAAHDQCSGSKQACSVVARLPPVSLVPWPRPPGRDLVHTVYTCLTQSSPDTPTTHQTPSPLSSPISRHTLSPLSLPSTNRLGSNPGEHLCKNHRIIVTNCEVHVYLQELLTLLETTGWRGPNNTWGDQSLSWYQHYYGNRPEACHSTILQFDNKIWIYFLLPSFSKKF